jgi:hypothetical protein
MAFQGKGSAGTLTLFCSGRQLVADFTGNTV